MHCYAYTGLKELFKSIDEDKSGTITVAEMRKALSQWGHKISEEDLEKLMRVADVDGERVCVRVCVCVYVFWTLRHT